VLVKADDGALSSFEMPLCRGPIRHGRAAPSATRRRRFATAATQQALEHGLAVDHVMEAVQAALGDVRHDVPVRAERVVGERPGDELVEGDFLEVVRLRQVRPQLGPCRPCAG